MIYTQANDFNCLFKSPEPTKHYSDQYHIKCPQRTPGISISAPESYTFEHHIYSNADPCKYQQTVTKQPCDLQFHIHIYLPALIYLQGEAKDTQFLDKNQLMLKLSIIVIRLVTKHFDDIDKKDYY